MKKLKHLFENNKAWAANIRRHNPEFFEKLAKQQNPDYMWIGCSDSRVPANEIVNLLPGELFVHRNIANVVVHSDLNCLSVAQFAVDVLKVKHIIVCGHYGCGGIQAALKSERLGLCDNWIRHVRDVYEKHSSYLDSVSEEKVKTDILCELNVIEQVINLCETTIVQEAWERNQDLSVHGWVYGINNGLLHDLDICISCREEVNPLYQKAIRQVKKG